MFGNSFADHVTQGYKFLMRYYSPGDKIYIFGFSRGAYEARILAEMVDGIGLLSRGNEEMVSSVWYAFSAYKCQRDSKKGPLLDHYMARTKAVFGREDVQVYFLGLFDCVNSVNEFEMPTPGKSTPYIKKAPAKHIRHAVSIDERRAKFKPTLMLMDPGSSEHVDIVETWFAGNHGDIGGGWEPQHGLLLSDLTLSWMVSEVMNIPHSVSNSAKALSSLM